MEQKVLFDWKSCVALGATVVGIILVVRMPEEAVEAAFNHLVDATKGMSIVCNNAC